MVKSYAEAGVKQANHENRQKRIEEANNCRTCNEKPCVCDREYERHRERNL